MATGEKILELAKTAHILYLGQDFAERRKCYRTAPSIAELFVPRPLSRSTCWQKGVKLKIADFSSAMTLAMTLDAACRAVSSGAARVGDRSL